MRIRLAVALLTLAAVLLWAGLASADGPLMLEGRTASSLTVSWSWSGQMASGWDLAWRARGDSAAVWRSVRKMAAQRHHTIEGLEVGVRYIVRVRALDSNNRPFASLQGAFATSSAAAGQSLDPRLRRGLAERLRLELESSRELCTAGTLTEVSWQISGGKPPYALQVEGVSVDVDADNARINCGALTEAEAAEDEEAALAAKRVTATVTDSRGVRREAADEEAALAAKRISAVVTDARGVRREAAIDVARARALPAPSQHTSAQPTNTGVEILTLFDEWQPDLDGDGRILVRHRPFGSNSEWSYVQAGWTVRIGLNLTTDRHTTQMAYLRHPLEAETPEALNWNHPETHGRLKPPPNLRATATHDTVIVSFDDQPGFWGATVSLVLRSSSGELLGSVQKSFHSIFTPRPPGSSSTQRQVVFTHVPPSSAFSVKVWLGTADLGSTHASTTGRTAPAPPGWSAPLQGPQNLRATATHSSITVRWDPPYEDPDIYYFLVVSEAETGREIYAIFPGADQREWTIRGGLYEWLRPNTRYRVTVTHRGLPWASAEIIVRTLSSPPVQGQSSSRRSETEHYALWPG